jgi:hypothetical protein
MKQMDLLVCMTYDFISKNPLLCLQKDMKDISVSPLVIDENQKF